MKQIQTFFLLLALICTACAPPISMVVNYSDDSNATGKMVIVPSRPISDTKLTVNGKLFAEAEKRVKDITVQNMPDGFYGYTLTCDNTQLAERVSIANQVQVRGEESMTYLHEIPPYSNGHWIEKGMYTLGTWVGLALLLTLDED